MLHFMTSDGRIVQKVLAGRTDAFGLLVDRHLRAVQAFAYARTSRHADAEDIAQETFLRAFEKLDTLREPEKFLSWLLGIARNLSRQVMAKRQGHVPLESAPETAAPQHDHGDDEMHHLLASQIEKLDESHREVLLLHYYAKKRTRTIAEVLGISEAATRKRLQRAREALTERMLERLGDMDVPAGNARKRRIMAAIASGPIAWQSASASVAGGATTASAAAASGMLGVKALVTAAAGLLIVAGGWQLLRPDTDADPAVESVVAAETQVPVERGNSSAPKLVDGQSAAFPAVEPQPDSEVQFPADMQHEGIPIRGIVLDADGQPVPHAQVNGVDHRDFSHNLNTVADESGVFVIHAQKVMKAFYATASSEGCRSGTEQAGPVKVLEEGVEGLVLKFYSGRIEGIVVRPNGMFVAGAKVVASPDTPRWFPHPETTTDSAGRFVLDQLFPATFNLTVRPPEAPGITDDVAATVTLAANQQVTGLRVVLVMAGGEMITGHITASNGAPIEGVSVRASGIGIPGSSQGEAKSDANGYYEILRLQKGVYFVFIANFLSQGESYSNVNRRVESGSMADFVLEKKTPVTLRIVDAETNAPVSEWRSATVESIGGIYDRMHMIFQASKTDDGTMKVRMDDGFRRVVVEADGYAAAQSTFTVQAGSPLELTIPLEKAVPLTGRVFGPNGSPAVGARVFLGTGAIYDDIPKDAVTTETDANGAFSLPCGPSEAVTATAYLPSYPAVQKVVNMAKNPHVDMRFSHGAGLQGLASIDGVPVPEASIIVVTPMKYIDMSDKQGRFAMSSLPSGDVMVAWDADLERGNISTCRRVNLTEGRTESVVLDVPGGTGVLEGYVSVNGQSAGAVAFVRLVVDTGSGYVAYFQRTESDGRFCFDPVPAGQAFLSAGAKDMWNHRLQSGRELLISESGSSQVDLALDSSSVVHGTVKNVTAGQCGLVIVAPGDVDPKQWQSQAALPELRRYVVAKTEFGQNGKFTVYGLEPGRYTLIAEVESMAIESMASRLETPRFAYATVQVDGGGEDVVLAMP